MRTLTFNQVVGGLVVAGFLFAGFFPGQAHIAWTEIKDLSRLCGLDRGNSIPWAGTGKEGVSPRYRSGATSREQPTDTDATDAGSARPFRFTIFPPPEKKEVPTPEVTTEATIPLKAEAAAPETKVPQASPSGNIPSAPTNSTKKLVAKNAKSNVIAGYKLEIPQQIAAASGIPLGMPLMTYCSTFNESGRQNGFVRLGTSFARQEGNAIALYVPLREVPKQSFTLTVAGISEHFDGKLFMANAQPVYGKIPGPHNGTRNLFSAISLGGGGYTLTAAFGPYAPVGMAGMLVTRGIIHHHANAMVKKAEKDYNAALAKGAEAPPEKKEPGE